MAAVELRRPLLRQPSCAPLKAGASRIVASLRAANPDEVWASIVKFGVPALVGLIAIVTGVLHPLANEASKSAHITTCSLDGAGKSTCKLDDKRLVMPFYPVSLTICAEVFSIVFAIFMVTLSEGPEAAQQSLLNWRKLFRLWPVGMMYGVGDLMQTFAFDSASSPVVVVIGQCKLLITALLTILILGTKKPQQWGQLIVISFAAIAGAHNGAAIAQTQAARAGEMWGAFLALTKAGISSSGAVFSERFYKEKEASFWVMAFRVQSMMLATSVLSLLLFVALGDESYPTLKSFRAFFLQGPIPRCETDPALDACDASLAGQCQCLGNTGWDRFTVLAMFAIAWNGHVTGLTLKHLSAVDKAICNALSIAVFYPAYVLLGFKTFDMTQASVIMIIMVSSYQYTMFGLFPTKSAKEKDLEKVPCPAA